jgi:hypothetical protein
MLKYKIKFTRIWHLSLRVRTDAPPAHFELYTPSDMNLVIAVSLYYEVPIIFYHNTFGCLTSLIGNYFFRDFVLTHLN